jgi:Transposase DDE domain
MITTPIIDIFCDIDDFYKRFSKNNSAHVLPNPDRQRRRLSQMAASEIMCILILFHMSHYRTFKDFYFDCVMTDLKIFFPKLLSYNRFIEIQSSVLLALMAYVLSKTGQKTNLYYLDSTTLKVCHNKRIYRNKVFKGIATRGKSSMGWFYGFKLHLVINHKGEIMAFCLTKGNVDDRVPVEKLMRNLEGLAAADKGYLGKKLEEDLQKNNLKLITKVRKNMKQKMRTAFEKFFLAHRGIVETVIEQLKSICQIEHSRHRSPMNFLVNLVSGLAAYSLKPRKPALKINSLHSFDAALIPN